MGNSYSTTLVQVDTKPQAQSARAIARELAEGELTVDAPYQRGSVWTNAQRVALIRSLLMGLPVPAVIINERRRNWKSETDPNVLAAVVDGKQRLETLHAWFFGDLAVPAEWFTPEVIQNTVEDEDGNTLVHYRDLDASERRAQGTGFLVPVCMVSVSTVEEEAEVYLLINGTGTAQSAEAMANAARVASGKN